MLTTTSDFPKRPTILKKETMIVITGLPAATTIEYFQALATGQLARRPGRRKQDESRVILKRNIRLKARCIAVTVACVSGPQGGNFRR